MVRVVQRTRKSSEHDTEPVAQTATCSHTTPAPLNEALLGLRAGTTAGVCLALVIAMAPLLELWFGFGLTPKVIIVALATFFPAAISTGGGNAPPSKIG